jgi:flagellar hook-length control protein FliK
MGTAATGTTAALASSTAAQSPGEQISIQVAKSVGGLPSKIDIDLKPEALGRVEIRLDLTQDGHVAARILAENPETLEILRAEAATLERALTDAGLKSESGDLQFDLKDRQQHTDRDGGHPGKDTSSEDMTSESQQGARISSTPRDADGISSGIDIQA